MLIFMNPRFYSGGFLLLGYRLIESLEKVASQANFFEMSTIDLT